MIDGTTLVRRSVSFRSMTRRPWAGRVIFLQA